ncbi:hypothetical protein ZHAS_00009807 [Anopheles sinensis]|uniref:Uncharacterized protein n=1 Tax=Anopheles sinensis TaxID=74873 RepID=A0A084VW00_ANOSI|nr:hypothetical protein ZHAS_00009807 [Anopheles sinensis]
MIPSASDDPEQMRGRVPPRPLMAAVMYAHLQRMSTEHGLNLSPEDILISAYLGHNLIYKPPTSGRELAKQEVRPEEGGKASPMAAGSA